MHGGIFVNKWTYLNGLFTRDNDERNERKKALDTSFFLENDLFRQKTKSFNDQLFNPDLEKAKEPTKIQVDLNRSEENN